MESVSLQDIIELLKNTPSTSKTLKYLLVIIQAFSQYSTTSQTLPPETLIPCCLFIVPKKFKTLLCLQEEQALHKVPDKTSIRLVLLRYLRSLLRLLDESAEEIKHVIVQGMKESIDLVHAFPRLVRRWLKTLVSLWSTSSNNINLSLRCFVVISKYLQHSDQQNFMWTIRRCYIGYFSNSKQISWLNLEHINFMINCFCELVKINDSRGYYVLFAYLRSIALQVNRLNKIKKKQKVQQIQKLLSFQMLNCFRLMTFVICRVESDQLSALIYPLIELMSAYEKTSQSAEYFPLKLHILNYLLSIMQATEVYVSHAADLLVKLARNSLFQKKISKKAQFEGDIDLGYRLSKTELSNSHLVNLLFDKLIMYWYWFESVVAVLAGGAQIIQRMAKYLQNIEYPYSGYKQLAKTLLKVLRIDSKKLYARRLKRSMTICSSKQVSSFQKFLSTKIKLQGTQKYTELKAQAQEMLKRKLLAQNAPQANSQQQQVQPEDEDEVNSGWSEAASGASQFQDNDQAASDEKNARQQFEDINYEGDPEDPDEAAAQWSEHQWSSQSEIEEAG